MNDWVAKCWGHTREIVDSQFYSKHELELAVGGYCSIHYHLERANRFIVVSGLIEVIEFFGPRLIRRMLGPDNIYDVPSLVPHMFLVYSEGKMFEEYFPDRGGVVDRGDIIRLIEGGIVDDVSKLPVVPLNLLAKINA